MRKMIARAARCTSWLFATSALTKSARPTPKPTVGTWFSSRCRWTSFMPLRPFRVAASHRSLIREQASGDDRPEPAGERRQRQDSGLRGRRRLVDMRIAEHARLEELQTAQRERDEDHLDVEVRIGQLVCGVGGQQDRAAGGVHPEAQPEHRQKLLQRAERQRRGEAENPEIHAGADPDHDAHADRVDGQDAVIAEDRVGAADPLRDAALFDAEEQVHHAAFGGIVTDGEAGIGSARERGRSMTRILASACAIMTLGAGSAFAQAKATITGVPEIPFTTVSNFLKLPPGESLGESVAVATNSKGNIYVFHRRDMTRLFEFDKNGNFLKEIGKGYYGF